MGYSHYWKKGRELNISAYFNALLDVEKIIEGSSIILSYFTKEYNYKDNTITISFNGLDDHEDCVFKYPPIEFECCKTAGKHYDRIVVACLCVLSESGLIVSSDGNSADWVDGHAWAETILGRKVGKPI